MKQNINTLFKSLHNLLNSSFQLRTMPVFTCSKSTAETLEQCVKFEICSKVNSKDADVFIINFKQILHIALVFSLLTLNKEMPAPKGLAFFP